MERLENMEAIEAIQTELEEILVSMMPVLWEKICLYARCAPGFAQTWYGFIESETGIVCARDFFWNRYKSYQMTERDVMRTLPKLVCHREFVYLPRTKIIDTSQQKFLDSYGLNRWADIQNMKEASRIINVLTQLTIQSQKQLETAALIEHAKHGTVVGRLNEISREIDVVSDHIMWRRTLKKYKPFYDEWKSKSGVFQKSYEKKFASELSKYREARDSLKAAYNQTGEKVPTLEELQAKKTALLQERSAKNAEYDKQKKLLQDVDFARRTLSAYLENEKNVQEIKRKKGSLE